MSDILENLTEDVIVVKELVEEINFVETDAEVIASDLISKFEEYLGEALYPGDERRIFLQGFAYVIADQLIHINETGRSNLLWYAEGSELDALGAFYNNARLEATPATTTIKFQISAVQSSNIVIPKGTRVTPDGNLFFATDEEVVFFSNETALEKEVTATATESGEAYNDFDIGQINKIVDGNPYVSAVSNTTVSGGGSDIETDDDYKERLRLSPFALSVAGPSKAYEAIALSVSGDIGDVSVYSPSAGVVEIAVVKDGGEIPSSDEALLTDILEACSDKDRRPLTDNVRVVPATAVDITIDVNYYVFNNDVASISNITAAIEDYKTWQTAKIGRAINPDYLRYLMMSAGAARVDIVSPAPQELAENEIANITDTTSTYSGSVTM